MQKPGHFATVARLNQLKDFGYPEVAFVGRSNCGKSSLLNELFQRKNLARTSSTPGRTQMIHLYLYGDVLFADLPGYGYTKTSKQVTKHWGTLLEAYCLRQQVCCFLCLLDVRRSFRTQELEFMRFLQGSQVSYVVVLTKVDKIAKSRLKGTIKEHTQHLADYQLVASGVHAVSSLKSTGVNELRQQILSYGSQGL